jgi:thiamine transporter
MDRLDTRTLVEGALCVALAAVLNSVFVWQMPNGGRVSLVMVPLVVFGLRRGWAWGLTAGALFGLLDLLIEPAGIVFPLQIVVDFPLAFGAAGLVAGLFRPAWRAAATHGTGAMAGVATVATVGACAARFAAHWVSGVVFFAQYAEGQPVWLYSLVYNGSYMLPATIVSAAAVALLMPALERLPRAAGADA